MSDVHYFAYGSNMNPERVTARGIEYSEILSGHLLVMSSSSISIRTSVKGQRRTLRGARMKLLRASCISWPTPSRLPNGSL